MSITANLTQTELLNSWFQKRFLDYYFHVAMGANDLKVTRCGGNQFVPQEHGWQNLHCESLCIDT